MKKFLAAFALCMLGMYLPVEFAAAADLQVTGAGTTAADGCYKDVGSNRWEGQGSASGYELSWANGNHTYCVLTPFGDNSTHEYYAAANSGTCALSSDFVDPGTVWHADVGTAPPPSFAETTCTSPPGPDTSATSTIDQVQKNLSTSFLIFGLSMFFVVWLMRKR